MTKDQRDTLYWMIRAYLEKFKGLVLEDDEDEDDGDFGPMEFDMFIEQIIDSLECHYFIEKLDEEKPDGRDIYMSVREVKRVTKNFLERGHLTGDQIAEIQTELAEVGLQIGKLSTGKSS